MSEPVAPGKKKFKLNKKTVLIGAGGLALGVGIWWWRKRHQTATPASTGTGTGTANPNTSQYGTRGFGGQWWRWRNHNTGGGTTTHKVATNAEWAQNAESYLAGLGYNKLAVAAALGAYLSGVGMTHNQYAIVQAAIAFEGRPPQGAPNPHIINGGGGSGQTHSVLDSIPLQ